MQTVLIESLTYMGAPLRRSLACEKSLPVPPAASPLVTLKSTRFREESLQTYPNLHPPPRVGLAAQCEIPPYRAIPFRDSIAEGGIAPICLVFIGYRASIAEIPLLGGGGVSHLHFDSQKRGRGYRTQLVILRHEKPHSAQ